MQMSTTHRLASASGLLFSILEIAALAFFVVVAAPHMPSLDADPVVHGSFYTQFAMENALSNYLVLLPMPLFAIFVAALYHALPRGVTATTSLVTGAALSIIWPIGIVVAHGGQSMAQQGLDPLTVMTFDGIAQLMLGFAGLPRAVFLIATAFSLNRSKTLTVTSIVVAALSILGSLALLKAEAYALTALSTLLFFVWLAVLSSMLVRRPSIEPRIQSQPLLAAA